MRAVQSIEAAQKGVTIPYLVNLPQSGNPELLDRYVIKFQHDNPDHEIVLGKVLFNELLSIRLAEELGLPVFEHALIKLPKKVIQENDALEILKAKSGVCFGTKFVSGTTSAATEVLLSHVKNKNSFAGIIFLDQFLLNIDRGRNNGNWFIDNNLNIRVFDFTHIFNGNFAWNEASLEQLKDNPPVLVESMGDPEYLRMASFISGKLAFSDILRKIKTIDFSELVTDIPTDWGITEADINSVISFLEYQTEHAEDIINQLVVQFKLDSGGRN